MGHPLDRMVRLVQRFGMADVFQLVTSYQGIDFLSQVYCQKIGIGQNAKDL